jgi:hypothetical protein
MTTRNCFTVINVVGCSRQVADPASSIAGLVTVSHIVLVGDVEFASALAVPLWDAVCVWELWISIEPERTCGTI